MCAHPATVLEYAVFFSSNLNGNLEKKKSNQFLEWYCNCDNDPGPNLFLHLKQAHAVRWGDRRHFFFGSHPYFSWPKMWKTLRSYENACYGSHCILHVPHDNCDLGCTGLHGDLCPACNSVAQTRRINSTTGGKCLNIKFRRD